MSCLFAAYKGWVKSVGVSYAAISQKRHQLCDDPKHLPFNKPTSPKMNQNSFFVGSWIGPLKGINGIILDIFSTMTFCCRFIRVFPWCGSARDVLAGIGRQKQLKLCTVQQIKYNLVIKIFCLVSVQLKTSPALLT